MSATTVIPKNRETIFSRLQKDLHKEGNNFILDKHFLLGKGWDKSKVNFLYLYTTLLCDFNCEVEHYFNENLKKGLSETEESTTDNMKYYELSKSSDTCLTTEITEHISCISKDIDFACNTQC